MTFIEAVKSGKKYRRPCYAGWHEPAQFNSDRINFCVHDILADDWEVEDVLITISEKTFDTAWSRAVGRNNNYDIVTGYGLRLRDLVKKELGL